MKVPYRQASHMNDVVSCIKEFSARTVVFDVEPLIADWNSNEMALRNGVNRIVEHISSMPGVMAIGFATNARRGLVEIPVDKSKLIFYQSSAFKPFWIARYKHLPQPGIVVGDQIATDGLLAWRLRYPFVHYKADLPGPRGPRLLNQLGSPIGRLIFR